MIFASTFDKITASFLACFVLVKVTWTMDLFESCGPIGQSVSQFVVHIIQCCRKNKPRTYVHTQPNRFLWTACSNVQLFLKPNRDERSHSPTPRLRWVPDKVDERDIECEHKYVESCSRTKTKLTNATLSV